MLKPTGHRVAWPVVRDPGTTAPATGPAIAYAPGGRPWPGSGIRDPPPGKHQNLAFRWSSTTETRPKSAKPCMQHDRNPAKTRHFVAAGAPKLAISPYSADIKTWHFVRKLGRRAGNSEPRMLHPGGRRTDIKTWEFTRKTPLGSLPISGQNPRKSAKNAATSGRAQGPWVRGQGPCFSQIFM